MYAIILDSTLKISTYVGIIGTFGSMIGVYMIIVSTRRNKDQYTEKKAQEYINSQISVEEELRKSDVMHLKELNKKDFDRLRGDIVNMEAKIDGQGKLILDMGREMKKGIENISKSVDKAIHTMEIRAGEKIELHKASCSKAG